MLVTGVTVPCQVCKSVHPIFQVNSGCIRGTPRVHLCCQELGLGSWARWAASLRLLPPFPQDLGILLPYTPAGAPQPRAGAEE